MVHLKQQLLNMGLNVFGLDLFVESYNLTIKKLLDHDPNFPKDKLNLTMDYPCKRKDDKGGDCKITITFEQINKGK